MKFNILLILVIVLMVVSGVLAGYQISYHRTIMGLESHIVYLDTKLALAQSRIESLENGNHESQTETVILETLQGKTYWAYVGNM